jgi:hypothetical protein
LSLSDGTELYAPKGELRQFGDVLKTRRPLWVVSGPLDQVQLNVRYRGKSGRSNLVNLVKMCVRFRLIFDKSAANDPKQKFRMQSLNGGIGTEADKEDLRRAVRYQYPKKNRPAIERCL